MSICLMVAEVSDLFVLPLAAAFANADDTPLVVLHLQRRTGQHAPDTHELLKDEIAACQPGSLTDLACVLAGEVSAGGVSESFFDQWSEFSAEDTENSAYFPRHEVRFLRVCGKQLSTSALGVLDDLAVKRLIIAPSYLDHSQLEHLSAEIYSQTSSETLLLRGILTAPKRCEDILVATAGGVHASAALAGASEMMRHVDGRVTALYVEAAVDEVAPLVGEKIATSLVRRTLGKIPDHLKIRVEVASSFREGLERAILEQPDVVLLGAPTRREAKRVITQLPNEDGAEAPLLGMVRAAESMPSRLGRIVSRLLRTYVPQLSRDQRVSLVERVQSSSQWNFDFTALMCLSTLIASLGLLLNSAAVVIGAMLIAPLMLPIVASGLAIVQGNALLMRQGARSLFQGFLLAYLIALVVGLVCRPFIEMGDQWPSQEMLARGAPNLLDLIVAFVSGVAAAYALGRPNLSSALPGVAIAAALIPPIGTAGMATAWGEWSLLGGALLLFLTNIIAIALATAVSLRAVGIRDTHAHGLRQRWSTIVALLLIFAVTTLAVVESLPDPWIGADLRGEYQRIAAKHEGELTKARWMKESHNQRYISIVIGKSNPHSDALLDELVAASAQHFGRPVEVRLEIRLVQRRVPIDIR